MNKKVLSAFFLIITSFSIFSQEISEESKQKEVPQIIAIEKNIEKKR